MNNNAEGYYQKEKYKYSDFMFCFLIKNKNKELSYKQIFKLKIKVHWKLKNKLTSSQITFNSLADYLNPWIHFITCY